LSPVAAPGSVAVGVVADAAVAVVVVHYSPFAFSSLVVGFALLIWV